MNAETKSIVFDWNSTLFNDVAVLVDGLNRVLTHYGRPKVDLDTYQQHYQVPFEQLYRNHGFSEDEILEILEPSKRIFHDHYEPEANKTELREGAEEILKHAYNHGVQSIILSNHIIEPIRKQLRRLEVEHLIAEVLAYADHTSQFRNVTKGQKLQQFICDHNMRPSQTMIVGDSVEEIEIAHEQNLISVAITGGCVSEKRLSAAKPDHIVHSLHELKTIMQERGFVS